MSAPAFVVTGTDTGVGKTVFSAALAGALAGAYWKPVQAGLDGETDSAAVRHLSGLPADRILPEAVRLALPAAPHRAAEAEGRGIDPDALVPPRTGCPLVIEGAGGPLVPLTRQVLYADVFARWALPVILVARTSLGTINHSLLAIEALTRRGITLHGIAFVGTGDHDAEALITARGCVRHLGRLPPLDPLTPATLKAAFAAAFSRDDFLPRRP